VAGVAKPSTAKAKGATTETLFVAWLRQWAPYVERRHLNGAHDRGDIAGLPGVVIEVKSGARIDLAGWMTELEAEVANDLAGLGVLVIRPKGRPHPDDWWAVVSTSHLIDLLRGAGWLPDRKDR
jgi:hypothetical protein